MLLSQAIIEVLKRHSSKEKTSDTKPLKQSEIVYYLKKEYTDEDSAAAQDLGRRLQELSGKNLSRMTPYTSENVFGKQRLTIPVDVLKNIQIIYDSSKDDKYIEFDFNVYDVVGNNIGLKLQKHHTYALLFLKTYKYFYLWWD